MIPKALRRPRGGRALAVTLVLLGPPSAAGMADVAILKSLDAPAWRSTLEALRAGLAGHPLVEHDLRGDATEAARVAAAFKDSSAILVALGPLAAQACREQAPARDLPRGRGGREECHQGEARPDLHHTALYDGDARPGP